MIEYITKFGCQLSIHYIFPGTNQLTRSEESKSVHSVNAPVSIADFYAGKSVFITGVTGFVGKVIIAFFLLIKTLSCCNVNVSHLFSLR